MMWHATARRDEESRASCPRRTAAALDVRESLAVAAPIRCTCFLRRQRRFRFGGAGLGWGHRRRVTGRRRWRRRRRRQRSRQAIHVGEQLPLHSPVVRRQLGAFVGLHSLARVEFRTSHCTTSDCARTASGASGPRASAAIFSLN